MGPSALLRPLGGLWSLLAIVAVLTGLLSGALGESHLAPLFLASAAVCGIPGLLMLTATRGMTMTATAMDAVLLALIAWSITPAFAAIPLYLSGYFTFPDAVFEAYSALTTTGARLANAEDLPRVFVLWRALLAWTGGYSTLVLAAAVFAALDKDLPAIRRSALLTIRPDNVFSHLGVAARRIALIYALLTGLIMVGLMFAGNDLFQAGVLAMGGISTSGVMPVLDGDQFSNLSLTGFWVVLACLFGSLNVSLFWDALRDRTSFQDPDLAGILALVVGTTLIFFVAPGEGLVEHVANAVFLVSTSGYQIGDDVLPVGLVGVFIVLIGGAAASTTGGVKVTRVLMLWKRMGAELAVLADPSSVMPVSFRGRVTKDRSLIAVWSYVLAFAAVLGTGAFLITLFGSSFEVSFIATASALSNAGPLLDQITGEPLAWTEMSENARSFLIPVMILGRLEVIAALTAVWAVFIRR